MRLDQATGVERDVVSRSVTSVFSGMAQPSSNNLGPIRTPSIRHITFFIGVPLNIAEEGAQLSFQNRSCHQKYGS